MDRHIQQQHRLGCARATKETRSRLDSGPIGKCRERKAPQPFFIPMHDIAYGRTSELLTTGGCIADVSDDGMSQVTAHTHVWATSTTQSFRDDPPGRVSIYLPWAGSHCQIDVRRVWHLCSRRPEAQPETNGKGAKRERTSQSWGRPRGRRGRHRCLKEGNLERGVRPVSICR